MPTTEHAELDALRDEIRCLREELRQVREALSVQQVHHYYPAQPWQPPAWTYYPIQTYCGGAAPVPQTYVVNTTCAGPAMIPAPTAGCAGPNPALTTLVNFS